MRPACASRTPGSIAVLGIDVRSDPAAAKQKIGAQLQSSALPDGMTPRQALTLCASFYPRAARPDDLIERFLLGEKADARFSTLSGGQRQRLALALAFVNEPEVVVLDEPTAGLDPPARRELHALIAAQRAAGKTLVFTTHHLEEARTLCDRVAFIDRGSLVALDAPEALIARCGAVPRLTVRTERPLDAAAVRALPGVVRAAEDGTPGAWRLETTAINRTITAPGRSSTPAAANCSICRSTAQRWMTRSSSSRAGEPARPARSSAADFPRPHESDQRNQRPLVFLLPPIPIFPP